MVNEKEFEQQIAAELRSAKITFESNVPLGGVTTDFLVNGPNGRHIVLELKKSITSEDSRLQAVVRADYYKIATKVDAVFVVVPVLKESYHSRFLIEKSDLIDVLLQEFEKYKQLPPRVDKEIRISDAQRIIFAAMPFSIEYEDVYFVAMASAAASVDAICKRVDYEEYSGDVVAKIKELIRSSKVVIADLSDAKPNVLYETGFAHALNRPTIHICSTPLEQLPFDVRNWNTIRYSKGQTHLLKDELVKRLNLILPK